MAVNGLRGGQAHPAPVIPAHPAPPTPARTATPVMAPPRPPTAPPVAPATRADAFPLTNRLSPSVKLPPDHPSLAPDLVQAFVVAGRIAIAHRTEYGGRVGLGVASILPDPGHHLDLTL